jgi:hypothetical protein
MPVGAAGISDTGEQTVIHDADRLFLADEQHRRDLHTVNVRETGQAFGLSSRTSMRFAPLPDRPLRGETDRGWA